MEWWGGNCLIKTKKKTILLQSTTTTTKKNHAARSRHNDCKVPSIELTVTQNCISLPPSLLVVSNLACLAFPPRPAPPPFTRIAAAIAKRGGGACHHHPANAKEEEVEEEVQGHQEHQAPARAGAATKGSPKKERKNFF